MGSGSGQRKETCQGTKIRKSVKKTEGRRYVDCNGDITPKQVTDRHYDIDGTMYIQRDKHLYDQGEILLR